MKIDILGRGRMPRTGLLLPAYDVEVTSLTELKKYAYLKFLKVYVHGTNLQITANNYVELFKVTNAAPVVDTTPVVKKEKKEKKVEPVVIEQVETPVTEEQLEPVAEVPVEDAPVEENVEVAETEEATLEATEEAVEETATEEHQNYSSKKKNKKR